MSADGWARHGSRARLGPQRPILLLGGSGMLGRAMRGVLENAAAYHAPPRAAVDLADPAFTDILGRAPIERPRAVINCAAWTDVDGAEKNESAATRINADAVGELAALCRAWDATLVSFGTDYVFDGTGTHPYPTDTPRSPINAYGRSKAAGERALEASGARFLQVRTSWLYAPWGKNFVRTIARAGREKPVLRVVNDQRGRPTSAERLAAESLSLLNEHAEGIWHVTDAGECTWFELAREIVRLSGGTSAVEPCASAEHPRPARRPAYSVLDIAPFEETFGPLKDWRANLADVIARLE